MIPIGGPQGVSIEPSPSTATTSSDRLPAGANVAPTIHARVRRILFSVIDGIELDPIYVDVVIHRW